VSSRGEGVCLPRLRWRNNDFVLHSSGLNFRGLDNSICARGVECFTADTKAQAPAAPPVSSCRPDGIDVACAVGGRGARSSIVVTVDGRGGQPKCLHVARREPHRHNGFVGMNSLREEVGLQGKGTDGVEHCVPVLSPSRVVCISRFGCRPTLKAVSTVMALRRKGLHQIFSLRQTQMRLSLGQYRWGFPVAPPKSGPKAKQLLSK
jgi:hypothetical protein